MDKTLLLLSGYPGVGKSYFSNMLLQHFSSLFLISQDEIIAKNFDLYGFSNIEEKEEVIEISRRQFYRELEIGMQAHKTMVSDYHFTHDHQSVIEVLTNKYEYKVITVRLLCDFEVLYKRQTKAVEYSFKNFIEAGDNAGYNTFQIGQLIELDTTKFDDANHRQTIKYLSAIL